MKTTNCYRAADAPRPARRRLSADAFRAGPLAGAVAVAVLIAGCGGSSSSTGSVAHIDSTTTSKRSATSTPKPNLAEFAQCMRAHGVPNFPDPNSAGQLEITQGSGVNPSSPGFQTASNDCKSLSPARTVSPAQSSQTLEGALRVAHCFRENGVPDFPDPKSVAGGVTIGGPGVDLTSPAFQRALKKCGSPLFGGGAPPAPSGGG